MTSIQKIIFIAIVMILFGNGCLLSDNETVLEACSQNPFVKKPEFRPGQAQLQIGYYSDDSFYVTNVNLNVNEKKLWADGIYLIWSPNMRNIAYREKDSICVIDYDRNSISSVARGTNLSQLSWSSDGKYILYSALVNYEQYEIYMVSLDGEITQLTYSPKSDDTNSVWSPSGNQIAFATRSNPVDAGDYIEHTLTISILDVLTKQVTPIVKDGFNPTWSPNGKLLLFESVDNEICLVNLESQNRSCLTSNYYDYAPQWSPNGQQIAFTRIDNGDWLIYTMNVDGSNQTMIASGIFPVWSPDGSQIAFGTGGENPDIYIVNADGTNPVLIAKNAWGYTWFQP
ncbi:MAG: PD40 domain-containing protein [Anaerolineales bacterium]|nr:PD40 domain-containing protein [Anaerolineales bacterium]